MFVVVHTMWFVVAKEMVPRKEFDTLIQLSCGATSTFSLEPVCKLEDTIGATEARGLTVNGCCAQQLVRVAVAKRYERVLLCAHTAAWIGSPVFCKSTQPYRICTCYAWLSSGLNLSLVRLRCPNDLFLRRAYRHRKCCR
jgi:hypothetical protein